MSIAVFFAVSCMTLLQSAKRLVTTNPRQMSVSLPFSSDTHLPASLRKQQCHFLPDARGSTNNNRLLHIHFFISYNPESALFPNIIQNLLSVYLCFNLLRLEDFFYHAFLIHEVCRTEYSDCSATACNLLAPASKSL